MTDILRTRIAKAIFRRFELPFGDNPEDDWDSWWDLGGPEEQEPFHIMADAVIADLGLERQDHYDPDCEYYRYVTDWISDRQQG